MVNLVYHSKSKYGWAQASEHNLLQVLDPAGDIILHLFVYLFTNFYCTWVQNWVWQVVSITDSFTFYLVILDFMFIYIYFQRTITCTVFSSWRCCSSMERYVGTERNSITTFITKWKGWTKVHYLIVKKISLLSVTIYFLGWKFFLLNNNVNSLWRNLIKK